jgi:hypothetical protein
MTEDKYEIWEGTMKKVIDPDRTGYWRFHEYVEPFGFAFQHEETGRKTVVDEKDLLSGFEKSNPRWKLLGPVFLRK